MGQDFDVIAEPDCNTCKWINVTEEEQQNSPIMHRCVGYNKRLYHRTDTIPHDDFIRPCDECCNDRYAGYRKREDIPEEVIDRFNGIRGMNPVFCLYKVLHYDATRKPLECKKCPAKDCQFSGKA